MKVDHSYIKWTYITKLDLSSNMKNNIYHKLTIHLSILICIEYDYTGRGVTLKIVGGD